MENKYPNKYKYLFLLDSETPTPDLEVQADKTESEGVIRTYTFDLAPVMGAVVIESMLEHVKNNCKTYRLYVVGEDPGHVELYETEDYKGNLKINEKVWEVNND